MPANEPAHPEMDEKLIINLWKNPDGSTHLRSVEVADKISRVRFSFKHASSIEDLLSPMAAEAVYGIVAKTETQRGLLMMPDLVVDLRELILSGCRVLVTAAENGIESIMIRFVKFFGKITVLFREGFSHKDSLSETAVDQAMDALERVYLPLRNFSFYLDDMLGSFPHLLSAEERSFLEKIRKEVHGMSHVTDLITHLVNSRALVSPFLERAPIGSKPIAKAQLSVAPSDTS